MMLVFTITAHRLISILIVNNEIIYSLFMKNDEVQHIYEYTLNHKLL